jgi:hypothetical protein
MSLGTLTEQYYLKDNLQFSPAQVRMHHPPQCTLCLPSSLYSACSNQSALPTGQADTWKALAHIPWMIKPLYGFFTDTFPIMGRRRRPYIIICGLTGAVLISVHRGIPQK